MKRLIRKACATCTMGTATVLAGPNMAMAQDVRPGGYWNDGWGYGHMMTGGFFMILFWGGLIVLGIVLVRSLTNDGAGGNRRDTGRSDAVDILRERFAHGEIDEEEYHARRKTLESSSRK